MLSLLFYYIVLNIWIETHSTVERKEVFVLRFLMEQNMEYFLFFFLSFLMLYCSHDFIH